jgi:hypothetical protein
MRSIFKGDLKTEWSSLSSRIFTPPLPLPAGRQAPGISPSKRGRGREKQKAINLKTFPKELDPG